MYENFVNKPSKHVHATRHATNWHTARGLQLSEIENCVAKIVCSHVCIKYCCKALLQEQLPTWIIVYQQSHQVRTPLTPFPRIRSAKQI